MESEFGECIGSLDFLPKLAYTDLETDINEPSFTWWGLYLVRGKSWWEIISPFVIVDNLDSSGLVFAVKDTRIKKPIPIDGGSVPCIERVAELQDKKWYHMGLYKDRMAISEHYDQLKQNATLVQLIVNIYPLQLLEICQNDHVKTDDVCCAIIEEREQRNKK